MATTATLIAGIPAENKTLYHQIRFSVGDPAALIIIHNGAAKPERHLIIRDIEMARARAHAAVDFVHGPADFAPAGGLSGDRETATAQSVAEFLRQKGASITTTDRTLNMVFADTLQKAQIGLRYDPQLGVMERRAKSPQEIEHLRKAQRDTELIMRRMCELIARAPVGRDGVLQHDGNPLTAERMFLMIDVALLELGYDNPHLSIVASGPEGGDCHNRGAGPLRTGEPVIVDIFPKNKKTYYHGDCTRTVVNGAIPDSVRKMHAAVVEAKAAATAAVRAGVTGHDVHQATLAVIKKHGYPVGLPPAIPPADFISIPHGTGHGLGLDVHEPPLLADKGPSLIAGDCVTIEPGLYGPSIGGVRVEDVFIVTAAGCENLGTLPESLEWK